MRHMLTDAHIRLLRALRSLIAADSWFEPWLDNIPGQGVSLVIEDFSSEPWASLTFAGMRHSLDVRLRGSQVDVEAAYDRLRALLLEPEIEVPGHFLAEMELVDSMGEIGMDGSMTLSLHYEALTIEE